MNSQEIRTAFLRFFESKQHIIVPSAPIVLKDDPTLMLKNIFWEMLLRKVTV